MGRKSKNKNAKLNKALKISFIICLISGIIALILVLGKGKIFGKSIISGLKMPETENKAEVALEKN